MRDHERQLIPQTGAAAMWCVDSTPGDDDEEAHDEEAHDEEAQDEDETCALHSWTCIWCSMTPPICGSCRPVTPPCPANGRVHTCACRGRLHAVADA
jgi:hypothetical protein